MQTALKDRLESFGARPCLISAEAITTYSDFAQQVAVWEDRLADWGCTAGEVIAVRGDYSRDACALILALANIGAIVVPLSSAVAAKADEFIEIAETDAVIACAADGTWQVERRQASAERHPLIAALRRDQAPGLILFSSGSTGRSKASLLNFEKLMAKFRQPPGRSYSTLVFLLLDHIGGINTLLHTLSQGGTIVTPESRTPDAVCAAIERHRVELLPTSPTFLNMLLISEAHRRYDLSSLKLITYGTEPMPPTTLAALHEVFPEIKLKQTYGLSELGILPTQSRDSGSLWMKLGHDGFEHKIVDGILWIRSQTAMLGYLNAPSPFDADGWFNTQDVVETDGEYVRVLGRRSEIINVGGEKVYPNEVESVLLAAGNVRDVTVSGRANPVTGQVVVARVSLIEPEDPMALTQRLRRHCEGRLERYKVPVRIELVDGDHHNDRFKKARMLAQSGAA